MTSVRARARGTKARGSVALEGAIALFPLAMALVLNLELMVRARRHAVLAWSTCHLARSRALGLSRAEGSRQAGERMRYALGSVAGPSWEETRTLSGLSLRGHWRYAALWPQPGKRQFEVNELCRFPF